MVKGDRGLSDPVDPELLNIANLAGSYYKAKKIKELLSTEIRKCSEEMAHLSDRGSVVERRLRKELETVEAIELQVAQSQRLLDEARVEMRAVEEENARLEIYARDLESKRKTRQDLRLKVVHLDREVQDGLLRLKTVQAGLLEVCSKKNEVEREVVDMEARLTRLEQEVTVMRSTRDMLRGQMPEHIDPAVFQDLQGNLSVNLEEYISEVRLRVSAVEQEIDALKVKLDGVAKDQQTLPVVEKELVRAVEQLADYAATFEARESILAGIATMEKELVRLGGEIDTGKMAGRELEAGTSELEEALIRNKRLEREMSDRTKHFEDRLLELEGMDNFAAAIAKLRMEAGRLDINLELHSQYLDAITKVKKDTEAMNAALKVAIAGQREAVSRFERALSKSGEDTVS